MMGFCFFVFFDACQGLVHLVFFFGACQCLVALISQNTGRHQINQKQQNPIIYSGLWIPIDWKSLFFLFCFLLFFGACQCFVTLCFVFFGACAGLMGLFDVEKERTYLQCFVLIFMQKSRPHGPQRKSPETVGKSCFAKWPFQSSLAR